MSEHTLRSLRSLRSAAMLLVLLVALAAPWNRTLASFSELPELALEHHASPSGQWILSVDPSTRLGAGPARYTMRHRGRAVWQATHPFTLWEVAVADDGRAGGAGYDTGYIGGPGSPGKFVVAVFDADGHLSPVHAISRQQSRFLHDFPHPRSDGVWIDTDRNVLVVRVPEADLNDRNEQWWRFDLHDGRRVDMRTPTWPNVEDGQLRSILRAVAVVDTPLTLVHWLRSERDATASGDAVFGSQFALLDVNDHVVWTQALPGDVAREADADHWDRAQRMRGLRSLSSGTFSVQSLARNRWLDFRIVADAEHRGGWRIEATGESAVAVADNPRLARAVASAAPLKNLKRLGVIDLLADRTETAKTWVLDIDIDAQGRIGTVERIGCDCERPSFRWTLSDTNAGNLTTQPLDVLAIGKEDDVAIAVLADGRWLIVASSPMGKRAARAATISRDFGVPVAMPDFKADAARTISGTPDGGFIALIEHHAQYQTSTTLDRYDADGRTLWQVTEDYGDETRLFSPEDVDVLASGEIVVLENIGGKVKFFDDEGRYQRTLSLQEAWAREPNYPSRIVAMPDGGFLVQDFGAQPQFVRMDRHGAVVDDIAGLAYADGKSFGPADIAAAANGNLWATDGHTLLELGKDGRAVADLGGAPDDQQLSVIAAIRVMPNGNILAMDERTHAVHRFGPEGRSTSVLVPDADDYNDEWLIPWMVLDTRDEVRAERSPSGHVRYDSRGRRVAAERFAGTDQPDEVLPHADHDRLWWIDGETIALVDLDGRIIRRHERDARGRWLSALRTAGVAPDGSLAVLGDDKGQSMITILSPQGDLRTTWPAPATAMAYAPSLAFDGTTLLLLTEEKFETGPQRSIFAFDRSGKALFQFLPDTQQPWWGAFHVRMDDRSELWLGADPGQLQRYEWPQ